ncbi:DUF6454 family protein [Streptomyces sp. NPDC059373]
MKSGAAVSPRTPTDSQPAPLAGRRTATTRPCAGALDPACPRHYAAPANGDALGGIVVDQTTGNLIGNNWGSRHFYEWNKQSRQIADWNTPESFIDYQDCQYVASAKMLCGGVTNLPQTNTAGGTNAVYELGGLSLVDLRTHNILNEVPFQQWSTAGHVATRNPGKLAANGNQLTMWAAPDNGDEGNGTEILTYQAMVTPAP